MIWDSNKVVIIIIIIIIIIFIFIIIIIIIIIIVVVVVIIIINITGRYTGRRPLPPPPLIRCMIQIPYDRLILLKQSFLCSILWGNYSNVSKHFYYTCV